MVPERGPEELARTWCLQGPELGELPRLEKVSGSP